MCAGGHLGHQNRDHADAGELRAGPIQGNVAGIFLQGVTLNAGSAGSFTIHLNKKAPKSIKVAWLALN